MRTVVEDYLWTFDFNDIDNNKLYNTCCNVEEQLKATLPPVVGDNVYGCFASYYHEQYNLFQYNCSELHKLYSNMVKSFAEVMDDSQYYVRCWANLFDKNKNIDWHSHWRPEENTYHGFYCVNTQGEHNSYTDYNIPGHEEIYRIVSRDGMCVFGEIGVRSQILTRGWGERKVANGSWDKGQIIMFVGGHLVRLDALET